MDGSIISILKQTKGTYEMTTYPLAEQIARNAPLNQILMPNQTVVDLYGYVEWVPNVTKLKRILEHRCGKINDEMVQAALSIVEERVEKISAK